MKDFLLRWLMAVMNLYTAIGVLAALYLTAVFGAYISELFQLSDELTSCLVTFFIVAVLGFVWALFFEAERMKLLQKLDDLRTEANLRTTLSKEQFNEFCREQIGPREARYFAALHNAYPELKKRIEELEARQEAAKGWLENILVNNWRLEGYNTPENNYQVVSLLEAMGEANEPPSDER